MDLVVADGDNDGDEKNNAASSSDTDESLEEDEEEEEVLSFGRVLRRYGVRALRCTQLWYRETGEVVHKVWDFVDTGAVEAFVKSSQKVPLLDDAHLLF